MSLAASLKLIYSPGGSNQDVPFEQYLAIYFYIPRLKCIDQTLTLA